MAQVPETTGVGNTPEAAQEWDEERLLLADQALKEMYVQVRELRMTVPRLVNALASDQSSPAASFKQIASATLQANADVKALSNLFVKPENKNILEHCHESREKNPKDIRPWKISEDPEWMQKS